MDIEKLNKIAQDDAREYTWYPGETSYESDQIEMEKSFADTFKRGVNWLMQQPLADRLTDEEKEKISEMYQDAIKSVKEMGLPIDYSGTYRVITQIFGADLFKEK